ncbi:MAG: hypothetical protein ACK5NT_00455 [Pyrinomonadaceae bacterium]
MNLEEIHKKNQETFISKCFYEENSETGEFLRSNACRLVWDKMTDGDENCDNSLGENFNQILHWVKDDFFISIDPQRVSLQFYFFTYIFWLYLFVERVDFVFRVLDRDRKSQILQEFENRYFPTFKTIRYWANFIKHPSFFLFSHWADFILESNVETGSDRDSQTIIDSEFTKQFYTANSNKRDLESKLSNNNNVIVRLPDLLKLTESFCDELNIFFNFIADNRLIKDFLCSRTTRQLIKDNEENSDETFNN